jgi:hypothetical protein
MRILRLTERNLHRIIRHAVNEELEDDGSYHEYVDADKAQALAEVLDVDVDSITNADNGNNIQFECEGDTYYVFAGTEDYQECVKQLITMFEQDPDTFIHNYTGENKDNFDYLEPYIDKEQLTNILEDNGINVDEEEETDPVDIYINYFGEKESEGGDGPCLMKLIEDSPELIDIYELAEQEGTSYGNNYSILGEKIGEPVIDGEMFKVYQLQ